MFELIEQLVLLVLAQRWTTTRVLAFIDKREKFILKLSRSGAAGIRALCCSHCTAAGKRRQPGSSAFMLTSRHFG
jgi:hypothetical protein